MLLKSIFYTSTIWLVNPTEPVKLEFEKTFCCLCCKSGPLSMVMCLPYTGYVPGQNIPFTLEVDNASDVRVDNVVVKLEKVVTYTAHSPRTKEREVKDKIMKLTLGGVERNGSKSFTQQLNVPETATCSIDQYSIIKCSYVLKAVAEVDFTHCNLSGKVPIVLGTVPIYQAPSAPPVGFLYCIPSAPPLNESHHLLQDEIRPNEGQHVY